MTSYKRLREQALSVARWNRLHASGPRRTPVVAARLASAQGPVVAVTDFMKAVPDQIGQWVTQPFLSLGTDGFGRSDTRDALRRFFETDAPHVVVAVLSALAGQGRIGAHVVDDAIARYGLEVERADPWGPEPPGAESGEAPERASVLSVPEVR